MKNINTFNTLKHSLTEEDIDQLVRLVGHRCRINTCKRLRSILTYSASSVENCGILDRLEKNFTSNNWQYFAGQDYTAEIKIVRDIILGKI